MPSWLRSLEQRARRIVYRTPAPPALRTIAEILFRTTMSFNRDDGSHMAAGVAYYAVFSLFPLTLASIALASFILDNATIQQRLLEFLEEQLPGSGASDFVQDNIRAIAHAHGAVGVVAVAALLWSGRAVFGAVHRVLNRAWKVSEPPHFVLYQVGQVTAAVLAALLFMSSTVFGTAGRVLAGANVLFSPAPWETIFTVVPFFLSTPLFIVLYRFVPDTRVRWREAAWGGAHCRHWLRGNEDRVRLLPSQHIQPGRGLRQPDHRRHPDAVPLHRLRDTGVGRRVGQRDQQD